MTGIYVGNGLGTLAGSASVLGSGRGLLGSPTLGQGKEQIYLNAKTGNLFLQRQDEVLIGRGPDINLVRTYNSQGTFDFDNPDNWQISAYKKVTLTGTANAAGSTVTRISSDGSSTVFTFVSAVLGYVNKDGGGAYDTLTYTATGTLWTLTAGNSRLTETYDGSTAGGGRITKLTDPDANSYTYTYGTNGVITKIVNANGETTFLDYDASKRLTQIRIVYLKGTVSTTLTHVHYTYDTSNRLTQVVTDLTPADNLITDGKTYTTSYTYDGVTKRVASITQTDGTTVSFTYDATGRVTTSTDGAGKITTLTYFVDHTDVKDPLNNVTSLYYNATGQLTKVVAPAVGGLSQTVQYTYNANGDVLQMIDARGNATDYTYDAKGNQTLQRDSLGNTITRTFGTANQLLTETTYQVPDPDGAGALQPTLPMTTRYVYDVKNHLRFVVTAEGRVTEYRYNASGQQINAMQYTGTTYAVAGLAVTAAPTETQMTAWLALATTDKSKAIRVDSTYDGRGQLSAVTRFSDVATTGVGIVNANTATTNYIYDQAGQLLQAIDARGVATTTIATDYLTSYVYDGLGRLISTVDPTGKTTLVTYTDASHQILTTYANGLGQLQTYDARGLLVSNLADLGGGIRVGHTYRYDSAGRLCCDTDGNGNNTYFLYDTAGRKVADIDGNGRITEYTYNANNQVIKTIRYYTPISSSSLAALAADPANGTLGNALLDNALTGWHMTVDGVATNFAQGVNLNADWQLAGEQTMFLHQTGIEAINSHLDSAQLTVTAGKRFEVSAYTGAHRATASLSVAFYNAAGVLISEVPATGGVASNAAQMSGGATLAGYMRLWGFVTAPVGAVNAVVMVRKAPTNAGSADSWLFVTHPYFAEATVAQTTASPLNLRPATTTSDMVARNVYDKAGRLVYQIDALGYVTQTWYDGAGQVTFIDRYTTAINLAALPADPQVADIAVTVVPTTDRLTRFIYDNDGKLRATIDAEAYLTELKYDAAGQLIETVRYANLISNTALWTTGTLAQLLPAVSGSDIHTYKLYDAKGQVIAEIDGEQYLTETTYDLVGNKAVVKRYANKALATTGLLTAIRPTANANDQSIFYVYNALNQLVMALAADGTSTSYSYDAVGHLTSTTSGIGGTLDASRTQTRRYDLRGRLIGELSGAGSAALAALGATPTQVQVEAIWASYGWNYGYDDAGRLTTKTNANGNKTVFLYDTAGNQIYSISSADQTNNTNSAGSVVEYRYNALGQRTDVIRYATTISLSSILTALTGNITAATISAAATATTAAVAAIANPALDSKTSYTYNLRNMVEKTTDAEGNDVLQYYNAFNEENLRIISDSINGGANSLANSYSYDRRGLLTSTVNDLVSANISHSRVYDAFGRLQSTNDAGILTSYQSYDRLGRTVTVMDALLKPTQYSYDAFDRTLTKTDRNFNTITYSYDTVNRATTMTTAEGVVTTTTRNRQGETVSVLDGRGNTTSYGYDLNGNLKTVTDSTSGITTQTNSYDNANLLINTVDGNGNTIGYSYDAANRVLSRTVYMSAAPNLVTYYSYDAKGQKATETDANGVVTQYLYDRKGQITDIKVDPTGLNLVTHFTYTVSGKTLTVITGYGSIDARTTQYVYDHLGRRTSESVDPAGMNLTTTYTYDAFNNVSSKTDANLNITRYYYDANNQLTYTLDALNGLTQNVYDAAGHLTQTTKYANALVGLSTNPATPPTLANVQGAIVVDAAWDRVDNRVYDKDGRLTYTVDALGYVTVTNYDGNGNVGVRCAFTNTIPLTTPMTVVGIKSLVGTAGVRSWDATTYYGHDSLNRLTYVVDATGAMQHYVYDNVGNVTHKIAYAALSTSIGGSGILSDAQLAAYAVTSASDRETVYAYDSANRQVYEAKLFTAGSGNGYVKETQYDADGRITKTISYANAINILNVATTPLNRANIQAALLANAALDQTNSFQYDKAGRLTMSWDGENNLQQYGYDAVGNKTSFTNENGSTWTYSYDKANRLDIETAPSVPITSAALATTSAVTITYGDITNNAATGWGNADAYSVQGYTGGAYMSAVAGQTNLYGMFGLNSDPMTDKSYTSLDYAWYTAAGGALLIYESGVGINVGSYTASDVLSVEYDGSNIVYKQNGVVKRTVATTAVRTFYFDSSFYDTGYQLKDVRFSSVSNVALQTKFTYDAMGNVRSRIEAYGRTEARTTEYEYDALGRQIKTIYPSVAAYNATLDNNTATGNGSAGLITRTESTVTPTTSVVYNAFGDAIINIDAAGNYSYKTYDQLGRVLLEVDAVHNLTEHRYAKGFYSGVLTHTLLRYGYGLNPFTDSVGMTESQLNAVMVASPMWAYVNTRTLTEQYNMLGQKTFVQNGCPDYYYDTTNGLLYVAPGTHYEYNAFGEMVHKSVDRSYNAATASTVTNDTYTYYDTLGRKVGEAYPTGYFTQWDYTFNTMKETQYAQALVNYTLTTHDAPISITPQSSPNNVLGYDRVSTTTYDRNHRVVSQSQDNVEYQSLTIGKTTGNAVITHVYDGVGNEILSQRIGQTTQNSYTFYDALGRIRASVTANGALTEFQRDAFGNAVKQVGYSNAVATVATTGYTAGAVNATADQTLYRFFDGSSHLTREVDANGNSSYASYDVMGQMVKQWRPYTDIDSTQVRNSMRMVKYDQLGQVIETDVLSQASRGGMLTFDREFQTFNSHGEVVSKSADSVTGLGSAAPVSNNASYDYEDGRIWRSYEGGIAKYYFYDQQGHITGELVNRTTALWTTISGALAAGGDFTKTEYDALGRVSRKILPAVATYGTAGLVNPTISQTMDRWGNVLTLTDLNNNTTTYRYNRFNQVIEEKKPLVNVVGENGVGAMQNPITTTYYSEFGQNVGFTDANNNTTTYRYDVMGNLTAEYHPDQLGSAAASYTYDNFGQRTSKTDANGYVTRYAWDKAGHLTQSDIYNVGNTLYQGTLNKYTYDQLGNRISDMAGVTATNYNKAANLGEITKYWYDARGNVVKVLQPLGQTTTYSYLQSHRMSETDGNGNSHYYNFDTFWKLVSKYDIAAAGGTVITSFFYDYAGHMTSQTDGNGKNQTYVYDALGRTTAINDAALNAQTTYEYDAVGNRRHETYVYKGVTYQNTVTSYDAAGRTASIVEANKSITLLTFSALTLGYTRNFTYDAVGNLRNVNGNDTAPGLNATPMSLWYKYNTMNRVTTEKGTLTAGVIGGGTTYAYDAEGNRTVATVGAVVNSYYYDFANRVTSSYVNYLHKKDMVYNVFVAAAGARPQTYQTQENAFGPWVAGNQSVNTDYDSNGRFYEQLVYAPVSGNGSVSMTNNRISDLVNTYDNAGNVTSYVVKAYNGSYILNNTDSYTKTLDFFRQYKEKTIALSTLFGTTTTTNTSTSTFDVNGNVIAWQDAAKPANNRSILYDTNGHVLANVTHNNTLGVSVFDNSALMSASTTAINKGMWQSYANDKTINRLDMTVVPAQQQQASGITFVIPAYVATTVTNSYFDGIPDPISSPNMDTLATSYTVQPGDTLRSIAQAQYGDANLWYVIAGANGLIGTETLVAGTNLNIPQVNRSTNTSGTFQPYNAAKAIGDLTPSTVLPPPQPPPPQRSGHCGGLAKILVAIVIVVVTIYTAGLVAAALAPVGTMVGGVAVSSAGAWATGMAVMGGTLGGSAGAIAAGMLGAAVGGAAGNIAGQGVAMATGLQDKFSWNQVGMSALTSMATAGVGALNPAGQIGLSGGTAAAVNAGAANAITQGVAVQLKMQDHFDWRNVAVAAVSAALTTDLNNKVNNLFGVTNPGDFSFGAKFTNNFLNGAVTQRLQIKAFHRGKMDYDSIAADAFGNALGNSIADGMKNDDLNVINRAKLADDPEGLKTYNTLVDADKKSAGAAMRMLGQVKALDDNLQKLAVFKAALGNPNKSIEDGLDAVSFVDMKNRVDQINIDLTNPDLSPEARENMQRNSQVLTKDLISKEVYFDNGLAGILPTGVSRLESQNNNGKDQSGFFGASYQDNNATLNGGTKFIGAARGTESGGMIGVLDWATNIAQQSGFATDQFTQAEEYATNLQKVHDNDLSFTGHSLGGGLAAAMAMSTGLEAVTFNAEGLSRATIARDQLKISNASKITAINVSGEMLSTLQDFKPLGAALVYYGAPVTNTVALAKNMLNLVKGDKLDLNSIGIPMLASASGNRITIPAFDGQGQTMSFGDRLANMPALHYMSSVNYSLQTIMNSNNGMIPPSYLTNITVHPH